MTNAKFYIAAALLGTFIGSPVFAQSNRQTNTPDQTMGGMDMQQAMNQCTQMRQQMKQGSMRMTPDMQTMMNQCDQMDRQMMGTPSSSDSAPRTRTR
jgi:hypothetical protein